MTENTTCKSFLNQGLAIERYDSRIHTNASFYQPKARSQVGFGQKNKKEKVTFAFWLTVASLFALF